MKRRTIVPAVSLLMAVALSTSSPTQAVYAQQFDLSPESTLFIDGTSNQSDWTVSAEVMEGTVFAGEATPVPDSLMMTIASGDIKSEKGVIMNRLMHQALKVKEHPSIEYVLIEAVPSEEGEGMLVTRGNLTLGGTTNEIEMTVTAEVLDDGSLHYAGMMPLKMTDYGMSPPTAMFGQLRTGNDVTVHFDVTFMPGG